MPLFPSRGGRVRPEKCIGCGRPISSNDRAHGKPSPDPLRCKTCFDVGDLKSILGGQ